MLSRKILIITNRVPYPLKDGGNMAMQVMIDGYRRAGWKVYLLSMNTSRHPVDEEILRQLYRDLYAFEWVDVDNDVKKKEVLRNFFFSKEPEHAQRFYTEDFRTKIKSVLSSFKPDVVQMESIYLSTYLSTVKKYSSAITVLRMHNVEYQVWQGLAKKTKNFIRQLYLHNLSVRIRNFERKSWVRYDLVLPITEKDAYLVKRLEEVSDMVVAPYSIKTDEVRPGSGNERWVAYHLGAMDWQPNRDGMSWFLTKVWPRIHHSLPRFEFYFAGRNMPEQFKKERHDGVHCLDEVKDADEFIRDKKILIVPITSGGGIRVKILEAMAAGKVVITTSTGIKGIEAMPGEHYLRAHKPEDFVKAIKWCLDNKSAAEDMAANAQKLIREKYDQDKVMSNIISEVEKQLTRIEY